MQKHGSPYESHCVGYCDLAFSVAASITRNNCQLAFGAPSALVGLV